MSSANLNCPYIYIYYLSITVPLRYSMLKIAFEICYEADLLIFCFPKYLFIYVYICIYVICLPISLSVIIYSLIILYLQYDFEKEK